jgi:hypothetical protein
MEIFKSITFNDEDAGGITFVNFIDDQKGNCIQVSNEETHIAWFTLSDFKKMMGDCAEFFKFLE